MNPINFDQSLQEMHKVLSNYEYAQEKATLEAVASDLRGTLETCCMFESEGRVGQYPELLRQFTGPIDVGGGYSLISYNGLGVLTHDGGTIGGVTQTLVWNSEKWSEDDLLVGEYS